jgi:hypothetical protein
MCTDGSQIKFENFDVSIFNDPGKLEQYIGNVIRTQAINTSIVADEIIQLNSTLGSLFYQLILIKYLPQDIRQEVHLVLLRVAEIDAFPKESILMEFSSI